MLTRVDRATSSTCSTCCAGVGRMVPAIHCYTPGCCSAFLLQSLRSIASPVFWRVCAVVLVEFWFRFALMTPQSHTPSLPKALANGPPTRFAFLSALHFLPKNNRLCSLKARFWGSPMISVLCRIPTASIFGLASDSMTRSMQDLIDTARNSESLPKGVASKIYGVANFLEQGIFGRVGYDGLMAIKARQDEAVTQLTAAIPQCFEMIEAVMKVKPFRCFPVSLFQGLRFLAASDAAEEADKPGSGGFHLIFFNHDGSQHRHSFVAGNCQQLQRMWAPGQAHIAQLELSMVLFALLEKPAPFRDRRGLWFLDNVAAVMTLVRGRSSNPDLTQLGHMIHLALFALRAQGYWEYVQSKSNWADDMSRLGIQDPWRIGLSRLPLRFSSCQILALILVFECL